MSTDTLTRAWTDVEFRAGLSTDELAGIDHPAGDLDAELEELLLPEAAIPTTGCTKWSGSPNCCC
ncbi:hypothetical protein FB566_0670 [Stackebrandtia endophytica]|uniref:Mersacidin/lichenicidin family type 2 lantibiotic n=1 Tax=Stackebrandtia endophytica TaxID=1496996 RepID=A0A543ARH6_9ACTN|nr:hypothetical protein [Stackebrandtia endophytica]TQL75174.1 hypothetical protein FB566_0670 [Stackebrandtia endophytica]